MERKLRYIEKEIKKDKIPVLDTGDNPDAPAPREMIDLEVRLRDEVGLWSHDESCLYDSPCLISGAVMWGYCVSL